MYVCFGQVYHELWSYKCNKMDNNNNSPINIIILFISYLFFSHLDNLFIIDEFY